MPFVIYRKSDQLVCGFVKRKDKAIEDVEVYTEINNIVNSELGGLSSDYAYIAIPNLPGSDQKIEISPDLKYSFIPHPVAERRKQGRIDAEVRLKGLGFTESEIIALIGG